VMLSAALCVEDKYLVAIVVIMNAMRTKSSILLFNNLDVTISS
jgi:hypothetical protein